MSTPNGKRTIDMEIIGDWVEPGSRVVDLGCGSGQLLEYLVQSKGVQAIGVDLSFLNISACVRKGLNAYQGDMTDFLREFPDRFFDRIICSRTLHELQRPSTVVDEALRASRALTVGFVNQGFWKNRLSALHGKKVVNEVFPTAWAESRPANHLSITDFEQFCAGRGITIRRRVLLSGNWRTPCRALPNLLAGYALYDLSQGG
ncbi:MAG: methionine biosynthesis protein MetW [Opitutaceae bacterium]|nr:methionine biosynthesis protein MetW [Opitutaceae bacterium]